MNIIIIENSIGQTGALNSILDKVTNVDKKFNFIFLIPKASKTKKIIELRGFECIEINFVEISRNNLRNVIYLFSLIKNAYLISRIVKRKKIEIIQVNDIYNLAGLATKLFTRIKVITHVRRMPESFPIQLYKLWVKIHLKFSDKILPVSFANARIFKNSKKIEVLYNPAMKKDFNYTYKNNDNLRVLYLANYTKGKGQEHAIKVIDIIKNVNKSNIHFKLDFVGSDFGLKTNQIFKKELENFIHNNKLSSIIELKMESTNVIKEITESDIVLNFSDSESLSKVTMESLFYRIPIIATNVGGTNEMIEDGINGFLVEKENIDQMVEKLTLLLDNYELRNSFHSNNFNYINKKFSPEKIKFQLITIYDELLQKK
jgi:glycosyltransferase involved in cell wall biosynthesis